MIFEGDSLKGYKIDSDNNKKVVKIDLPNVEVSKVGKWIKQYTAFVNDDNQIVTKCHCSNCHGIAYFRSMDKKLVGANFCPICGSFMERDDLVND